MSSYSNCSSGSTRSPAYYGQSPAASWRDHSSDISCWLSTVRPPSESVRARRTPEAYNMLVRHITPPMTHYFMPPMAHSPSLGILMGNASAEYHHFQTNSAFSGNAYVPNEENPLTKQDPAHGRWAERMRLAARANKVRHITPPMTHYFMPPMAHSPSLGILMGNASAEYNHFQTNSAFSGNAYVPNEENPLTKQDPAHGRWAERMRLPARANKKNVLEEIGQKEDATGEGEPLFVAEQNEIFQDMLEQLKEQKETTDKLIVMLEEVQEKYRRLEVSLKKNVLHGQGKWSQ